MRIRTTIAAVPCEILRNHMPQILSIVNPNKLPVKQVRSLLFRFSFNPTNYRFFASSSFSSSSGNQTTETQVDLSSFDCSGISKAVILRCSHLFDAKEKLYGNASLKDLLLDISDVVPDISRRFRRFGHLKPENVLEILLGFEYEYGKVAVRTTKVGSLWGVFSWASRQDKGFKHLPKSCEIMASVLINAGMLREVELLLVEVESRGILLDCHEIFSNLIHGYVVHGDVESAVFVYDLMRKNLGLVPSLSCFCAFIDLLAKMKRNPLAFQVCLYRVWLGIKLSDSEIATIDKVIRLLCGEGKIQEARNLLREVVALGFEPSDSAVNEIAYGYCEKNDFEDSLSFLVEMKRAVDVIVGNKIIYTLCSKFDVGRADVFRQELEHLGFRSNEVTFGILISWSCHRGELRSAFIYLSEILSRGLKPDVCTYNALIGSTFRDNLWELARHFLDEMVDSGIIPNLSTFTILLAGYCKARQFEEAKMVVCNMVRYGLIEFSSLSDPLSEAFIILGFNPETVKLKRDNDAELSRSEFFDNIGNGLYLDTDLDEYEERINNVLENSMLRDFNFLVMRECSNGNLRTAFKLVDEMVRWGQEPSLSVFSTLLKKLCTSRSQIRTSAILLQSWPKLVNQLDEETLNFLVQEGCKKGFIYQARLLFNGMLQRDLAVSSKSYTALLKGLCQKGILRDLLSCWIIARSNKWVPGLDDCKALWEYLCQQKLLEEALDLLESMLVSYPQLTSEIYHMFIEKLCGTGFSCVAQVLVEELQKQGCFLGQDVHIHLLRGLCEEKNISSAFTILDNMLAKNLTPSIDISVILIPQLCSVAKFEKAVALREISLKDQPTGSFPIQSAMIKGFCLTKKLSEAESIFQEIWSNGLFLAADIYNMMVRGYCQASNRRKVGEALGVMIRRNISLSISSYGSCIRMMCMEGRFLQASSLKEFMLGQSKSHNLIIYNVLIFYLLSAKNSLHVNKALDDLGEKGLLPDEVTYNFLVYGFSLCLYRSSSMQYFWSMISKGLKPNNRSLRIAISFLCEIGELEKALELSQEMELRGWHHGSVAQNAIVEGLLSHGRFHEAEQFLARLVDKGLILNSINYDNLIKRFCHFGRMSTAVSLLDIMLKKEQIPDFTSYDSVICGFCTCNRLDQAMNFLTDMLDRDLKPSISTWNILVNKLCKEGETAEAEKLLVSMVQLGETPTREMYSSVINKHHAENNLRKASELMQLMQQSGYEPDFETHWSLISNLSNANGKDKISNNNNRGFLSRLLSGSGYTKEKETPMANCCSEHYFQ